MGRDVIFAPEALGDLQKLYNDIAFASGAGRAQNYTDRITTHCLELATFPERGIRRDDLRPRLRTVTYRRRVTIAFHIADTTVIVDRILYGGRDLKAIFDDGDYD